MLNAEKYGKANHRETKLVLSPRKHGIALCHNTKCLVINLVTFPKTVCISITLPATLASFLAEVYGKVMNIESTAFKTLYRPEYLAILRETNVIDSTYRRLEQNLHSVVCV